LNEVIFKQTKEYAKPMIPKRLNTLAVTHNNARTIIHFNKFYQNLDLIQEKFSNFRTLSSNLLRE